MSAVAQMLASVDGELTAAADGRIAITDQGLIRGDGVFEVIRVIDGRPFALEQHHARLQRSAANLRLPLEIELIEAELTRLLGAAGDGVEQVRVIVTRGGRRIILAEPLEELPATARLATITYAPTRVLDGIKSLSYAANMLATRLAVERGYDDALLVSPQGHVLEAPTSSLFWVGDGELRTPPLSEHILASITRAIVIEVAGAVEYETTLQELHTADEAFLSSTVLEVQPIVAIDEQPLPAAPGPVSARVAEAVAAHIARVLRGP